MGGGYPACVCPRNILGCYVIGLHEGKSQDSLLRRFQKMVQMSVILREAKAHQRFISKRDAARIKAKSNARRRKRQGN